MPRKNFKKKSYKKRSWRRGRGTIAADREQRLIVNRRNAVFSRYDGIGRQFETKLKTVFFKDMQTDANGLYSGYLFPGSAFDPCGNQSDIQPAGYDQLKLLFARYVVKGADVRITFHQQNTMISSSLFGYYACAYPSTVEAASVTFQGAASQPWAQSTYCSSTDQSKTLAWKLDAAAVVGRTTPVTAEDNGGLIAASPAIGQNITLPFFLNVVQEHIQGCCMLVEIIQDVIFDQRIQVVDV